MNGLNRPDRIKRWSCHKLECFADYIDACARSFAGGRCYYLEPYASYARYICEGTDCCIDGASLRALNSGFSRYVFIAGDSRDAESLEQMASARDDVDVVAGNFNNIRLLRQVLDLVPRSASSLAFIDPPGYRRLHWTTIKRLAAHGTDWKGNRMELLIVLPLEMALLRNLTRPECRASITRFFGNREWQEIRQQRLEGRIEPDDVRQKLVELFKKGLRALGYRHVDDFKPVQSSRQPFYHLILASDRAGAGKMLRDAWGKPRYLPCELLYSREDNISTDTK